MKKIDLIIDALMVTNSTLWSAKIDQALFVARELQLELNQIKDNPMKEQRELQTRIDELERYVAETADIQRLRVDAERYRWLNKYASQLLMVTEKQMNDEIDRIMARGEKWNIS